MLSQMPGSLQFIRAESLHLRYGANGYGQRKVRGRFSHAGEEYTLAVTDPVVLPMLQGHTELTLAPAYLCVSLGVTFNGYAYKLMASVITEHRARKSA